MAKAADCKSATVGSTPTSASFLALNDAGSVLALTLMPITVFGEAPEHTWPELRLGDGRRPLGVNVREFAPLRNALLDQTVVAFRWRLGGKMPGAQNR